jgi:hypothetical protein
MNLPAVPFCSRGECCDFVVHGDELDIEIYGLGELSLNVSPASQCPAEQAEDTQRVGTDISHRGFQQKISADERSVEIDKEWRLAGSLCPG